MTDYKIVKPNKIMLSYWHQYNQYRGRTLSECYKKPSACKKNAWNYWCKITSPYNTTPTVLCYNTMCFAVGFIAEGYFVVVTSRKILATKVQELQILARLAMLSARACRARNHKIRS